MADAACIDRFEFGTDKLFSCEGYSVVPNFLEAEELRELAPALAKVLSLAHQPCMSRPGNDLIPLRWNDAITARILSSERRIRSLQNLLKAPELKWLSGYISTKPAQGPPPSPVAPGLVVLGSPYQLSARSNSSGCPVLSG